MCYGEINYICNHIYGFTSMYTWRALNLGALPLRNPIFGNSSSKGNSAPRYANIGALAFAPP